MGETDLSEFYKEMLIKSNETIHNSFSKMIDLCKEQTKDIILLEKQVDQKSKKILLLKKEIKDLKKAVNKGNLKT